MERKSRNGNCRVDRHPGGQVGFQAVMGGTFLPLIDGDPIMQGFLLLMQFRSGICLLSQHQPVHR